MLASEKCMVFMIEMQKFDFCREGQRVLYDNLNLTLEIFAGDEIFYHFKVLRGARDFIRCLPLINKISKYLHTKSFEFTLYYVE